jgi:hypothetical protein
MSRLVYLVSGVSYSGFNLLGMEPARPEASLYHDKPVSVPLNLQEES